ncbi:hypothetical protein HL653_20980 [Sphingomonas sp. AP4-R1]|uniref:hypothetical protein n=1 Tax=Sphingomonas sp. AP4-R1 TaxID=2735134 RepID=UPI0014934761|nr:hypothetical protein [Sphingomonas sp. AP4-R1]QJU59887.1 hypothetical protein HL653_20980 [Sphingomonas sp. AP4-R1]
MTAIGAPRNDAPSAREIALAPGALDALADAAPTGAGALHRLLNQPSTLDRLVGDAGPLGKFRTDDPDRMPSGTAALTLRASDALNRLAARLGLPGERILSGNPVLRAGQAPSPPTELPAGERQARTDYGVSTAATPPIERSGADNQAGSIDRGNRRDPGA